MSASDASRDAAWSPVVEYGARRAIITIGIVLATLLELIDTTIVNVALPYIQGNIGASQQEGAFVVTGYLVANTVVIPLTPWLQHRFGRRRYYLASISIFVGASLMCGLSHSLAEIVFWRVVQGTGGGGLISTSQAILRDTYPERSQGIAQGVFAIGAVVGPTIGPLLGGTLTDNFSWPWVFFVNVPVGLLAAAIVARFLRDLERAERLPLDAVGVALLAVGLGALQYVLDQGQEKDWFGDRLIVTMTVVAACGLAAFVTWSLFGTRAPVVDLRVLKNPGVAAGSLLGMCLGVSLMGSLVTLPQYVESSLGFTATMAGEVILFRALFVMLLTPPSARLAASGKTDPRLQIGAGFVMLAISNLWLANVTTSISSFWTFLWPLALSGLGLAQIFVPLSLVVFSSAPIDDVPKASSMFNLARQMGGSIATAILVTLIARDTTLHQTELGLRVAMGRAPVRAYLAEHGGERSASARARLDALVAGQSVVLAYADTARFVGVLTFVFVPLVVFLRPRRAGDGAPARVAMEV